MRQVAVCKTYDCQRRICRWIVIQCPTEVQDSVVQALYQSRASGQQELTPVLHDPILQNTADNWRDFINFLESEFSSLVRSLNPSVPRQ